jgi:hypothetical protein
MRTFLTGLTLVTLSTSTQDPAKQPATPRVAVGKPAPVFTLNDHNGQGVRVGGESERWIVLAFFPKAATPG